MSYLKEYKAEIAGYAPPDIAHIRTEIVGGRITKVEKKVV